MSDARQTEQSGSAQAGDALPAYSARRRSGLIVVVAAALVLATLGGLSALILRGSVAVPQPVVALIETRLRDLAGEQGVARFGRLEIALSDSGRPRIIAYETTVRTSADGDLLRVPRLEVTLSRRALARAELRALDVQVDGAALRLARRSDGFLRLALQSGETLTEGPSVPALIARIDEVFDRAPFDQLETLRLSNLSLQVTDPRLERGITLSRGAARVDVGARRIAISLALDLEDAADAAGASLRFQTERGDPETRMSIRLSDLPAGLLAQQSPAFAALDAFDGTASARLDGALAPDGALAALEGALDLGPGTLEVPWQETPVALQRAALSLGYDPRLKRFSLSGLEVASDLASGRFAGTVDVLPLEDGSLWPDIQFALDGRLAQLRLTPKLRSDAEQMDFRLSGRFSGPDRRLDLGQIVLTDIQTGARAIGDGRIDWPVEAPPVLALNLHVPRLPAPRVAQFWPAQGKGSKVGAWLANNVLAGELVDANVALRLTRGARPDLGLSFGYENAAVQVLREFPVLRSAHGHATLFDHRFLIRVADGGFAPEGFPPVAVDGSSFEVPDTRIKGTDGRVRLEVSGDAEALLDVLARPPVRLSDRFSLPPQGIQGQATGEADFLVPLRADSTFDLGSLSVEVSIADARMEAIAQGLDLTQATLDVSIEGADLDLRGQGALAEVPVDFALDARLDTPPGTAPTVLQGGALITDQGLRALGVQLPEGLVAGQGAQASYRLTLNGPDEAPALTVRSDLVGVALNIPQLDWRKPAARAGEMSADILLARPPEVRALRLAAAGLAAEGSLSLQPGGGGLAQMRIDRLALGGWLDVGAELAARGPDTPPALAVTTGTVDVRELRSASTGAGAQQPTAIAVRLDEVIVSDDISLINVSGTVQVGTVVTGQLTGMLNGQSQVRIQLGPGAAGRQGVRVTANDGGRALAAAGILSNLRGGPMDLSLEATGAPGSYAGRLQIADTRLVENPAAIEILSALSVVGLVEQLANGGGIGLTEVSADLSLAPEGVTLRNGLANGPSLGVTFEGVVMLDVDRLDLQGVISPVYLLNSIGGGLFGTPGEGLIGVNYRVTGSRADPSVSVNPLSVLTPGIFRDLFRRPPPQLTQ